MADQLDSGPGALPSQEPDAQPAALARKTPPTSRAGSSRYRASGRSRWKCRASNPRKSQDAVDELVKLYVSKSGSFKKPDGKTVAVALSEVDDFVANELKLEEKLMYLGEKTISRLGCFGCHTIPGFENAKPIGTALNDWGSKSPPVSITGTSPNTSPINPRMKTGDRDGTDLFYQEKIRHETRIGFLYQKLHRPRSYDYLKKNEKYKTWDDRLRMPQFAWANDPAAIEEVMTFVLGLTGERIPVRYLPKTHTTPAQIALARGLQGAEPVQLRRLSRPGDAQIHHSRGRQGRRRPSRTSRATSAPPTPRATPTYLAELYPTLSYDPKKKLDSDEIENELGIGPDDGSSITIEGMPIGLFENELTVQLWQPVTIRGYTFNVGDNVTLDQTKIQKTPPDGGDFAWLYATYQAERTGQPVRLVLEPAAAAAASRGEQGSDPMADVVPERSAHDPPRGPVADAAIPLRQVGDDPLEGDRGARQLLRRAGWGRVSLSSDRRANHELSRGRNQAHPDYLGRLADDDEQGFALPPVPCDRPVQADRRRQGRQRARSARGRRPIPARTSSKPGSPTRAGCVPFTAMPQNIAPHGTVQILVPKTFENQPFEMVRAVRDTLLNYVNAVELQLAEQSTPRMLPPSHPGPRPSTLSHL